MIVPESENHSSVLLDSDHSVFDSDILQVTVFVIGEVGIRQPQLVSYSPIHWHHRYLVAKNVAKRQSVVFPVLSQVNRQCEVLNNNLGQFENCKASFIYQIKVLMRQIYSY